MIGNKLTKAEGLLIKFYIILEIIIFLAIKWAEFTMPYSIRGKIMYSAIVLNFLVMTYFYLKYRGDYRVPLALTLTLVADYYLTLMDTHFELGVFCFFLVQLVYALKLGFTGKNIILRLILLLMFGSLMHVLGMPISFCIVCGLSIATLIGNVICAWILCRKEEDREPYAYAFMLALGLTLFAGCDLSLGLRIISSGMPALKVFHDIMNFMIWVFYSPSQVLLVLYSVYKR